MSDRPSHGARFQRRPEDFTCERCGLAVNGNGYTNHCPRCLWSKHVDVLPGDRAAVCGGAMRPLAVERSGDGFRILFRCQRCGFERPNKSAPEDDFEALLELARRGAGEP